MTYEQDIDDLTYAERLTLLRHAILNVFAEGEEPTSVMDILRGAGVPIEDLLGIAAPLSSPPYSERDFKRLMRLAQGPPKTPRVHNFP